MLGILKFNVLGQAKGSAYKVAVGQHNPNMR